jgi:cytochrome c-type biogenesis protein
MSGVASLVASGPLLLAIPVAAAAGAVTFLSPCVLPLVPGYLSYITGMSGISMATEAPVESKEPAIAAAGAPESVGVPGAAAATAAVTAAGVPAAAVMATATTAATTAAGRTAKRPSRRRAVTGTMLFVLGFSALFATYGLAFGQLGYVLRVHLRGLTIVLGALLILLGLLFAGVFDRFSFAGRIVRPSIRPRVGLASAPLLGVLFGLGWTPCIGPTLSAVLLLGATTSTAIRGATLAFVYGLGIGVPFLLVAFAVERGVVMFSFARRHARAITRIGGMLLVAVGLLEVTGAWASAITWLQVHWTGNYVPPL